MSNSKLPLQGGVLEEGVSGEVRFGVPGELGKGSTADNIVSGRLDRGVPGEVSRALGRGVCSEEMCSEILVVLERGFQDEL